MISLTAFTLIETSPDINCHQGIATDGTYYYGIDTQAIRKFDLDWNLISENNNAGIQVNLNHIGDGFVYDNVLYIPCENVNVLNLRDYDSTSIAKFNTSDLSLISVTEVDSDGTEISGIGLDVDNSIIYAVNGVEQKIVKFQLSNFTKIESIQLSERVLLSIQGITYNSENGYLYINKNDGTVYRCTTSGEVQYPPLLKGDFIGQGIDFTGDNLLVLNDPDDIETVSIYRDNNTYIDSTSSTLTIKTS